LGGYPHDGAIAVAQHFEPQTEVVSVADGRHDAERIAAEGGADLCDLSEQSTVSVRF
jgi:hypothetical protein